MTCRIFGLLFNGITGGLWLDGAAITADGLELAAIGPLVYGSLMYVYLFLSMFTFLVYF